MSVRLFVSQDLAAGGSASFDAQQCHYLHRVMRLRPGDEVSLFNGRDGEWRCRIEGLSGKAGTAIAETRTRPQDPEMLPWLAFAPLKKGPMDFLIQKSTELGVGRLQPVITRRTETRRLNSQRLRHQGIEAAEQCGRLSVPVIEEPLDLAELLAMVSGGDPFFAALETGEGEPIANALKRHGKRELNAPGVLIGPEGGFEDSELTMLRNHAAVDVVNLGPRILRAETAAVAALSCVQALIGDWNRLSL